MNTIIGMKFETNDGYTFGIRLVETGNVQTLILTDSKGQRFEIGNTVNEFKNLAAAINFVAERNKA